MVKKKFNFNHNSGELCSCNNNNIISYCNNSSTTDIITLFSTKDNDNKYELKYYVLKSELVLVITNICNPTICETIVISDANKKLPFGCPSTTTYNYNKPATTFGSYKNPDCKTYDNSDYELYDNSNYESYDKTYDKTYDNANYKIYDKISNKCSGCDKYDKCDTKDKFGCCCNKVKGETGQFEYEIKNDCHKNKCNKGECYKGQKGDSGNKGDKGDNGDKGRTGIQGEKGNRGRKGDTGDRGKKGDHGEKGESCDKCKKGEKGDRGKKGDQGEKGESCDKCKKGEKGDNGTRGDSGEKGKRGDKGDKGDHGDKGKHGERGDNGNNGDKGDKGKKGDKGQNGIGFRFLCEYNPEKTYHLNDVVRVEGKNNCGKIYVYTGSSPSGPLSESTDIATINGWKLMLKDGICCKKTCSEPSVSTDQKISRSYADTESGISSLSDTGSNISEYNPKDASEMSSEYSNSCGISASTDTSIKKILADHKKFCQNKDDVHNLVAEKDRPMYYKGEWLKYESYDKNDLVKYKNVFYIATKKNSGVTPGQKSLFWNIFINNGVRYQGNWKKDKTYSINDIVRSDNGSYIAIDGPTKGIPISDTESWALLCKDGTEKNIPQTETSTSFNGAYNSQHIIESYNQKPFHKSKPMTRAEMELDLAVLDDETDSKLQSILDSSTLDLKNIDTDFDTKDNCFYYACKQSDIKYSLSSKKPKWHVPITFEKTLETGSVFDSRKGQILFNRPGIYKITVHINFTGTNLFSTLAYLLKPSDDPNADLYQKNRKIQSSKMSITCASQIKNHLQYCFIVKVKDALSTLVFMSEHQTGKMKHIPDDKEITIFGKEKTWILVEKIN